MEYCIEKRRRLMDSFVSSVLGKRIEKTIKNLEKNNFFACRATSREELLALVEQFVPAGAQVGFGGSVSLSESGVLEYLRGREDIELLDREKDPSKAAEMMKKALTCDVYFASSNAVTENGELFNVDGRGSRVAPMIYGPESVVLIVGANKIVPDIAAAEMRVKKIAAPANTARLNCETPCRYTGECADCKSPARICCDFVTMKMQRVKDRIKVIITDESLGF